MTHHDSSARKSIVYTKPRPQRSKKKQLNKIWICSLSSHTTCFRTRIPPVARCTHRWPSECLATSLWLEPLGEAASGLLRSWPGKHWGAPNSQPRPCRRWCEEHFALAVFFGWWSLCNPRKLAMSVAMCMNIYIYIYIYIYIFIYVYIYTYLFIYLFICLFVCYCIWLQPITAFDNN